MNSRTTLMGIALGRVVLGAAMVAAPSKLVGAGWVGAEAQKPATQLLLRAVGARDVALGLGTLIALREGSALKPWLIGATIADATDFGATLAVGNAIPASARAGVGVLAGGATVAQLALLRELD